MDEKLKTLRTELQAAHLYGQKLYFAKVDVRACFDTLPQNTLLNIVTKLCRSNEYNIAQYIEVKPGLRVSRSGDVSKPGKNYRAKAVDGSRGPRSTSNAFGNCHHPDSVLLDNMPQKSVSKDQVMQLLQQHLNENIVKIGKKFWRQKKGIPQGSVLSSLLCSLCYTEFEQQYLSFLSKPSLLLRLIDDFLLITPSRDDAIRFMQLMFRGIKQYGISVRPEKALANFGVATDGFTVGRIGDTHRFPYCGMLIDVYTLDIAKEQSITKQAGQCMQVSSRLPSC